MNLFHLLKWVSRLNKSVVLKKYKELKEKYKNKEIEYKKLVIEKERKLKESRLKIFINMLRKGEAQFEWDDTIFNFTLEKASVHKDKLTAFKFYSCYESTIKIER